jgi:hypothetical protein
MDKFWGYLLAWAPLAVVLVAWVVLRPRYGGHMTESIALARECAELTRESVELQKNTLSCLEEIKAELKIVKAVKG